MPSVLVLRLFWTCAVVLEPVPAPARWNDVARRSEGVAAAASPEAEVVLLDLTHSVWCV